MVAFLSYTENIHDNADQHCLSLPILLAVMVISCCTRKSAEFVEILKESLIFSPQSSIPTADIIGCRVLLYRWWLHYQVLLLQVAQTTHW